MFQLCCETFSICIAISKKMPSLSLTSPIFNHSLLCFNTACTWFYFFSFCFLQNFSKQLLRLSTVKNLKEINERNKTIVFRIHVSYRYGMTLSLSVYCLWRLLTSMLGKVTCFSRWCDAMRVYHHKKKNRKKTENNSTWNFF